MYRFATTDHIPINLTIDIDNLPGLRDSGVANTVHKGRLDWTKTEKDRRNNYCCDTDLLLKGIFVHEDDALLCRDSNLLCEQRPC